MGLKKRLPRKLKKAQKKYQFGYLYHPRTKWMRKYIEWRKRTARSGEYVMGKSEFEQLKKILNARPKDGLFANVVFMNEADKIPVAIKNLRNN